jgi:hypothetical protein
MLHLSYSLLPQPGHSILSPIQGTMGQRHWKKIKHTKFTMRHTKLKALSFGSSRSKSFNGRTRASIESGEGLGSGGLLIGSSWGCRCYHEVVWTSSVVLGHYNFLLCFNFGWSLSRVRRHMSDQSDGPLSEEHVCTHTFFMKRDGRGVISVCVQPSCLVLYSWSVLTVLFSH